MKVTIITNYWKNSPGGGVKTYVANLVEQLEKRHKCQVSVIFKEGKDNLNYKIEESKIIFAIKSFLKLKKLNPKVIHSQGTWYCLLPGYIYKKLYGVRLVHTFHTQHSKKLSYISNKFMQTLLNECDCVTFVSKQLKKDNERYGLEFNNTAITYAGVHSKKVSQEEIKRFYRKYHINQSNYILLAQGFMSNKFKANGVKILITALNRLINTTPHITLILTGEGLYSKEVKGFVEKMDMSQYVIFTGLLKNPYVPLEICDIYTHITLAEGGVSLSLLEAMVMGKPILTTKIGGIPEAINDDVNGILVEPCEEKIVEKIEYLIKNPNQAKKMGDNAKQTARNKFTWEISADLFIDIYKN